MGDCWLSVETAGAAAALDAEVGAAVGCGVGAVDESATRAASVGAAEALRFGFDSGCAAAVSGG